jgi:hypothetical protein
LSPKISRSFAQQPAKFTFMDGPGARLSKLPLMT